MLGAAGEQLAVYNGVQVKFDKADNETERFVYMYLHSFISAGGQLVTLANGTKQFNIVDNLGSVRCIVSWDGTAVSSEAFDYKPFGDLQEAGEENRIGYFGEQRDKESDYFAMGFRLYDPEIGRFLAIDPLLDIQPSQTPYHYCFNNPTSFTDPTGLYPEKEKGDKVQSNQSMYFYDEMRALLNEFGWRMVFSFIDQWNTFAMVHNINELNRRLGDNEGSGGYGGSGGGGSGRTGTSGDVANGFILTDVMKARIQNSIRVNVGSGVNNPDQAVQSFWNKFWEANQYMTQETYDYYSNHFIIVQLLNDTKFAEYSTDNGTPNAKGWHYAADGVSIITFAARMFTDPDFDRGFYNPENPYLPNQKYNIEMLIMHEFGHGYAYYTIGREYSSWGYDIQENHAIYFMNNHYNEKMGLPIENYYHFIHWFQKGQNPIFIW